MKNQYEIRGEITVIYLNGGHETLIDTELLPLAMNYPNTWYAHCPTDKYYVCGWLKGKPLRLHRWVTDAPEGYMVDHINGDTLDNRLENLRVVTSGQNQQNRIGPQRNCKSGVRGVCWHKQSKKWTTHIRVNGQRTYLGLYDKLEDAERAVIEARKNLMTHSVS